MALVIKAAEKPTYKLLSAKIHDKLSSSTYLYPENNRGEYDCDNADLAVACALKVYKGFCVVDISVFTNITFGNIDAPTMMVVKKGAEMILAS